MTQGLPPSGFSAREWELTTLLWLQAKDFWLHYAPRNGTGPQQLRVCERSGYDFARLTWQSCAECRRGHIMKIRVTNEWQRQAYGRARAGLTPASGNERRGRPLPEAAPGGYSEEEGRDRFRHGHAERNGQLPLHSMGCRPLRPAPSTGALRQIGA